MTDSAMLALAIKDVQDGSTIKINDEEDRIILPFYVESVAAGTSVVISAQPQLDFIPRRLVYGGERGVFVLDDMKVGRNSQFVSWGSAPMECFPPHPEGGQPIDNLLGTDTCRVSMMISLTIRNVTDRGHPFGAIIYGAVR